MFHQTNEGASVVATPLGAPRFTGSLERLKALTAATGRCLMARLTLPILIAGGAVLRLAIVLLAENRLDHDEATVGVMAVDILEGKSLPFFFYGMAYNGGGAWEAFLGAAAFAVFGPSEMALKLCMLLLWTVTACLFARFCRLHLSPSQSWLAVLFFSFGTPFFLEWSVKARGGFAETVIFTVLLLWIAKPSAKLGQRPALQSCLFGLLTGAALWASEMILPMVPVAAVWMFQNARGPRRRLAAGLGLGLLAGLVPLAAYNLIHRWANLKVSAVYALFLRRERPPLTGSQMILSADFILGPWWWLFATLLLVSAWRLVRERGPAHIGQIILLHTVFYVTLFWLSGLRYLPVPPSRVLYSLYPGLAILFAGAAGRPETSGWTRVLAVTVFAVWGCTLSVSVGKWILSGAPREAGSWRGSWSLVDGRDLEARLRQDRVNAVYTTAFTAWPLRFATRTGLNGAVGASPLAVSWFLPETPDQASRSAAFVLRRGSALEKEVRDWLTANKFGFKRADWKEFSIYSGVDSRYIHRSAGLRPVFERDWAPFRQPPDGFN
jgi:hypothetical protein